MARPNINSIRSLPDFATLYQWNLDIVRFPSAVASPSLDDVNLRCVSADIPAATITPITTEVRGHKTNQPGILEYNSPISLTFTETVDNKIQRWIRNWRNACTAVITGSHAEKSSIHAVIGLTRLNRQDEPMWRYIMYGCFFTSSEAGSLGSDNDTWKPTLSLVYDYFVDEEK